MGILAWIAVIAFVGYVVNAGYRAAGGADADWVGGDDDDTVSLFDDDDWMGDDDIYTSPVYSNFVCNIWHDPFSDDFSLSSSSYDDGWMSSDD